jgi:hypothetical protein
MAYLFGDSSPSDLSIDYIDFLRDALDLSTQVLGAHERMLAGDARGSEARRSATAEVVRLEALGAAHAKAIEAFDTGGADTPTSQCAKALVISAADTVQACISRVRGSEAADLAGIEEGARRDRATCVDALAVFMRRHDLPAMTSELHLQRHDAGYFARLHGTALGDVRVVVELEIPSAHIFASVARVDRLIERLEVHAPEASGWLRKETKLKSQRLDKEFITGVVARANETVVQLRSDADGSGGGYDLTIPDVQPVILRRAGDAADQPSFELDDTDSGRVRELRDKILAAMDELRRARKSLVEAAVGETMLSQHRDPKILVERLVATMAPVVREIIKRSLAPTELVLKRQTGDGRREEIFVSRRDLQNKMRGLSPASRAMFAPLGLGEPPAEEAAPIRLDDSLDRLIVSESAEKPA